MAIDISTLLPHAPPMLMISELLGYQDDQIECRCEIGCDNPLLVDGKFPPHGGLEMVAQASGLLLGLRRQGKKPAGAIVRVRSFTVAKIDTPQGAHVDVTSSYLHGNSDAAIFNGKACVDGKQFFAASLMLMTSDGWMS